MTALPLGRVATFGWPDATEKESQKGRDMEQTQGEGVGAVLPRHSRQKIAECVAMPSTSQRTSERIAVSAAQTIAIPSPLFSAFGIRTRTAQINQASVATEKKVSMFIAAHQRLAADSDGATFSVASVAQARQPFLGGTLPATCRPFSTTHWTPTQLERAGLDTSHPPLS